MYYVQVETFQQFLDQTQKTILTTHWKDLALDQEKTPLKPQYDIYFAREAAGELLTMVLYRRPDGTPPGSGQLVGYYLGFIAPGLHYADCLTATMDIFYIRPEFRDNPLAARRLLRAVERELKTRGVHRWFVGSKLHKDIGRLFKSLQFNAVETYYSKWIGE